MRTYLIKRFFLMIPTIFGISLVVFIVINLAPGSPAAMTVSSGDTGGAISADQVASKETYQIFKKHFNLDKEVLLNRYPWLSKEKVDRRIKAWIEGSAKEKIAASDALSDYGPFVIPQAITLLEEARVAGKTLDPESDEGRENRNRRRHLVFLLAQNSLVDIEKVDRTEGKEQTRAQKIQSAVNKEYNVDNGMLRDRVLPDKFTPAQASRVEETWIDWYRGMKRKLEGEEAAAPEGAGREGAPPGPCTVAGLDAALAEAKKAETKKALKEGGRAYGEAHRGGFGVLIGWVRDAGEDLPARSVFAAHALHAMLPAPEDPLEFEKIDRRRWVKSLTVVEGWPEARAEYVVGRWEKWWQGREADYTQSGVEKLLTAAFDTRFAHYWKNLVRLDFGESLQYKGKKVIDLIKSRLKVSVTFALLSFLIAYTVSIPIGICSAVWKDSVPDRVVTVVLFALYSLPSFFTAVVLLRLFTIGDPFSWFPGEGFQGDEAHTFTVLDYIRDVGWHLVLPVICLSYASFAALSRYMRAGLLEVIRSDYIRTARAKGLSEWVVILKHALRNGVIPILTMVGGILPALIGGSLIIEYVFNINGMGLLMIEAIFRRDYNVVMADSVIMGFLVLCGLLLTDILYVLVDPRISFE
ncbi:MAG: ABC transporter permease [Planctomycetota bacterium]|jgi:peptide/nickel transport system permease protein